MNASDTPPDAIVWCPGCGYEATFEAVPLASATFGTCPDCQHGLHTLPPNASEEYKDLLRRF